MESRTDKEQETRHMLGLKIPFGVDSTAYRAGLATMRSQTKKWGGEMSSMLTGVLSAGALVGITKRISAWGSEISDMALRTKTSTKEWMVYRDAARDAGVETSSLERAFRNLNLRTQEAIDGNKGYSDALRRLGIDSESFAKLSTSDKFQEIARAVTFATNQSEAYSDMADILGMRAGPQLIEVLNKIATEGYDKIAESAVTMDDETAAALDSSADAIAKFSDQVNLALGKVIAAFVQAKQASKSMKEIRNESIKGADNAIRYLEEERGIKFSKKDKMKLRNVQSLDGSEERDILAKYGLTFQDMAVAKMKGSEKDTEAYRADLKAKAEEQEKIRQKQAEMQKALELEKAQEELAKAEAKAKEKTITLEEKINDLMKQREALVDKAQGTEAENILAKAKLVAIEADLQVEQEKKAKEDEKAQSEKQKKLDEITKLEEQLTEVSRQNAFSLLSESEQVEDIAARRQKALADAAKMEKAGDAKGAVEKKIEAEELMGEMLSMQQSIDEERKKALESQGAPRLTVSSLTEIGGGGGGVFKSTIDPQLAESKEQTALLRMLVANTGVQASTLKHKDPVA